MPLADSSWAIGGYFGLIVVTSIISFLAYGWDKFRAARDGRRVPEKTLHLIDLAGGWPGGLLARRVFRHKTIKRSFVLVFWITAVAHLLIVGGITYAWVNR